MTVAIETMQLLFDRIVEQLLSYPYVPDAVSLNEEAQQESGDYDARYDYRAVLKLERPYFSPTGFLVQRYGDLYLDEMLEVSTTTPRDILKELRYSGFDRLEYLEMIDSIKHMRSHEQTALLTTMIDMLRSFENVYASGKPVTSWAQDFVTIAMHHYLRWDRPFITNKLPKQVEENRQAQEVFDQIRGRRTFKDPGELTKAVKEVLSQPKEQEVSRFQEALDHINSTDRVIEAPVSTLPLPEEKTDPFFDNLGGMFTFVTELPNPTLKYGQLIKKEVIYSIDNIRGDVYFVFEVIDDRGYSEQVRVLNLEKAIVCKGDQIHYKDFNKVVKTMLARLQK